MARVCIDANSAACRSQVTLALEDTQYQFQLGSTGALPEHYLGGADLNAAGNRIVANVMARWNYAQAQSFCDLNPQRCVTRPEGALEILVGVGKGVANSPIELANLPATTLNGWGYIFQMLGGKPLRSSFDLINYPEFSRPQGPLQEVGAVGGSIAGAAAITAGATAAAGKLLTRTRGPGMGDGAKVVKRGEREAENSGGKIGGGSAGFDNANLQSKLEGYLLDATHPQNQTKATWFKEALGFDKSNWQQFGSQISFNESKAIATKTAQYGQTFEQVIPITGANGKTIDVPFVFMKDNTGTVRLVTGIPAKK